MSGPGTKGTAAHQPPKPTPKENTEASESDVGEEDPGSALDSGETESLTRDDVRSSES